MKNKITLVIATLTTLLVFNSVSFAQDNTTNDQRAKKFATHKAEVLANLNEEKATLDQAISCVSAAQNKEAMEKCHEAKKASMMKMRDKMMQNRKQHLKDELGKIEQKEAKSTNTTTSQ